MIGILSRPSPTRLSNPRISRILNMTRPVTRAFSANDMEKNDRTRQDSCAACDRFASTLGNIARDVSEIARSEVH